MPLPVHWVNQQQGAELSVLDRGFAYGDGVFETLRCYRGHLHLLEQHLQRMQLGCDRLEIECPQDALRQQLRTASNYLLERDVTDASLRLSVTRGYALETVDGRGYAGAHEAPNVVLSIYPGRLPWRQAAAPLQAMCYHIPLAAQPLLAGIKHCNRLEQVLAAKATQRAGFGEAIMLNHAGHPVSGVAGNLFMAYGKQLYTPELSECGVAGTVRAVILAHIASRCGFAVQERTLPLQDFYQADELMLCNSLVGIQSIIAVDEQAFPETAVADKLRGDFFDWVDAQAP